MHNDPAFVVVVVVDVPEMEPLQRQSLHLSVLKRREMVQPVLTKAQPRQLPCPRHVVTMPAHLHINKPLFKTVAPTDNMRPKLHDKYTRHQWLKGYTHYYQHSTLKIPSIFIWSTWHHVRNLSGASVQGELVKLMTKKLCTLFFFSADSSIN